MEQIINTLQIPKAKGECYVCCCLMRAARLSFFFGQHVFLSFIFLSCEKKKTHGIPSLSCVTFLRQKRYLYGIPAENSRSSSNKPRGKKGTALVASLEYIVGVCGALYCGVLLHFRGSQLNEIHPSLWNFQRFCG